MLITPLGDIEIYIDDKKVEYKEKNIAVSGKVEPSKLKYSEVQKGTYEQTFSKEKDSIRKRNQERKEQAYNKSNPTLSEGAKATAVAAAIEGAMALCIRSCSWNY